MALEGTVKVPGIKQPFPKWAVAAGLAGVGVAIILYYRKKQAAPAATPTDQYPPDGTVGNPQDPYSTDPATGQTYGNEAVGSGGTFSAFGPDTSGLTGTPDTGTTGPYQTPGGPPFATNNAWADWVTQELQAANPAISAGALINALGLYLAGQPLTAAEKTYVFDAEALAGPPPVAGPGGYPPKVRSDGSKGGKTFAVNPVRGLKAAARYTQVDLHWDPAKHATSYEITWTHGGRKIGSRPLTATHATLHNLREGEYYHIAVLARPAEKGAHAAAVEIHTQKSGR